MARSFLGCLVGIPELFLCYKVMQSRNRILMVHPSCPRKSEFPSSKSKISTGTPSEEGFQLRKSDKPHHPDFRIQDGCPRTSTLLALPSYLFLIKSVINTVLSNFYLWICCYGVCMHKILLTTGSIWYCICFCYWNGQLGSDVISSSEFWLCTSIALLADQSEHTVLIRRGGWKTGALTECFRQRVNKDVQFVNNNVFLENWSM